MNQKVLMSSMVISVSAILLRCLNSSQAAEILTPESKARIVHEEWQNRTGLVDEGEPVVPKSPEQIKVTPVMPQETVKPEQTTTLPPEFLRPMSLKGGKIPLVRALQAVADTTGLNLVCDEFVDKQQVVSFDLTDQPAGEVASKILYPFSYGFKAVGKDLVIVGQEMRSFRVALPPVEQSFNDVTSNESYTAGEENNTQNVKVGAKVVVESKLSQLSFWQEVETNLAGMVSPTGKYTLNRIAGMVTVIDLPGKLDRIAGYMALLNREVNNQIAVDVKVVEVTLSESRKTGVDWNIIQDKVGSVDNITLASNFAAGTFASLPLAAFSISGPKSGSGVSASGVQAVLKALQSQGEVEIVSQPKVLLMNNQPAVIQVGTTTSYVEQSSSQTTQAGDTITSVNTNQVQEGVTMRIAANVVNDLIYLSVFPVVTTVDQIRQIDVGKTKVEAPQTTTKSINTMVKVRDGQTVVIGGLITSKKENGRSGVPLLSRIPLVGGLFEYRNTGKRQTELIIFITPKKVWL